MGEEQSLEVREMPARRGHPDEDVLVRLAQRDLLGPDDGVIEGAQEEQGHLDFVEHVVACGPPIVLLH